MTIFEVSSKETATDRIRPRSWVLEKCGISGATQWRLERAGRMPGRVQISPGRVGWYESEIREWLESRRRVGGGS